MKMFEILEEGIQFKRNFDRQKGERTGLFRGAFASCLIDS